MNKKISIIHPSRGRAKQAFKAFLKWSNRAFGSVQYILSIDDSDPDRADYIRSFNGILTIVSNNNSAIEAINNAAKVATGDIFIVISDDFDCPENWDRLLLDALQDKEDFVVKTQDGCQPWIITLPIMDRKYYERFGYIYHPDYKHMFCDTEMTHVGHLLGRVITLPLVFPHNHYTTGINAKDAINIKNDATWEQGEALYLSRLKNNFGLKNTLTPNIPKGHRDWLRAKGIMVI